MAASVRKIYVDSRFGKGTASRFDYELSETVTCNDGCVAYITGFTCPVSFLSVQKGLNDRVFWLECDFSYAVGTDFQPDFLTVTARILTLPPAVYNALTLATVLQDALNGAGKVVPGTYAVTYEGTQNHLQVSVSNPSDPQDGSCFAPLGDKPLTDQFWHDQFWKTFFVHSAGMDYSPSQSPIRELFAGHRHARA